MLEAVEGTFYENGVGAPTVAYDTNKKEWVMYFEARFSGETKPGCPTEWGLGRATSPDGLNWTVDDAPVINPIDDSFYGCVVAHPIIIFDEGTWRLWFKAQQENDVCGDEDGDPTWGCSVVTGVGYASSTDGVNFDVSPEPMVNVSTFGFPAVAKIDGVMHMMLAYSDAANDIYEMWQSLSFDDGETWSVPSVNLTPGYAIWSEDEVFNPSLVCENEGAYPFTLFVGGRNTEEDAILTAGLGRAYSSDSVAWFLSADNPLFEWETQVESDWRHWDAMRLGRDYILFFSQKDENGRNRVGMAYTFDEQQTEFEVDRISTRICDGNLGWDTAVSDSGNPNNPGPGGGIGDDTAINGGKDGSAMGGCGCVATPASGLGAWWLLALGVPWVRRRR
jgi:MYXO-CTERM domain-containing protein